MAAVPTDDVPDPKDLRDDLTFEIIELGGNLKGLGYDTDHITDFLKETRALAMDVHIQKLRKQIERTRKLKDHVHSKSTSAIVSALSVAP